MIKEDLMKRILTLIIAVLMVVGVSMIAVSCGDEPTPSGTTAAPVATTKANEPTATEENTSGGTPVATTEPTIFPMNIFAPLSRYSRRDAISRFPATPSFVDRR